jgi:hypothetical protein
MIDQLGGWLQHNLVVFMAVIVLPLKFVVVRLCGDREAEAAAVFAVPEDLCWVALGLVLGDIINSGGAFHHYFAQSDHASIDIVVAVGANFGFAIFVHVLTRLSSSQFKLWRAAQSAQQTEDDPKQGELALPNGKENLELLMLRHLLLFCFGYGAQLLLVLFLLHWISKVISAT